MNARTRLGFGILGLCIVIGLAANASLLSSLCRRANSTVEGKEYASDQPDPEALFTKGMQSITDNDSSRADLLTQLALKNQSAKPSAVPTIWEKFCKYLDSQKLPQTDRLNRLIIYRNSVDAALQNCVTPKQFEEVWTTRMQVIAVIAEARKSLLDEVRKDTGETEHDKAGKSLADALAAFRAALRTLEPKIVSLTAAVIEEGEPAQDSPLNDLARPGIMLLDRAIEELIRLRRDTDTLEDSTGKQKIIEASAEFSGGQCEQIIGRARQLSAALNTVELSRWFALTRRDDQQGRLNGIHADCGRLLERLAQLQQLRYNFWALHQLHVAESATSWDAHLGRIELGQLHPTVAALYSKTYDSRINLVERPEDRVRIVQTILGSKKMQLASF